MDSVNSNSTNNISPFRVYTLIVIFLILVVMAVIPSITNFRENNGCEAYLSLAKEYNLTPSSCFQYSFQKYIVPAVVTPLPFLFIILVLLFKEKKKEYQLIKAKQEKTAFWLLIFTVLLFLLSFVYIKSIHCEGFGCLGLGPSIAARIGIFPPLIFCFSTWFIGVRYQWSKRKFLAVTVGLIILLLFAYTQTPLL